MRTTPWICCVLFVALGISITGAQRGAEGPSKPEPLVGTWSGTWEGGGAGGSFELTLEQGKDGPVTGKVTVTGEPAYKASLRSLSLDANKMNARYDFPPDEAAEVVLAATFDGSKVTGTWALHEKATGAEAATGTWTATRK